MSYQQGVYYTVESLAALWGCARSTVYTLISTKKLRAFKCGVSWRITDKARAECEKCLSNVSEVKQ